MVQLKELQAYCDALLGVSMFRDYAPNGLQVEGRAQVAKIVTGVTACQALLDEAVKLGADAVLVHHGYFWKNEPSPVIGIKRRRLATLIKSDMSLLAYHLPLDAHAELGNNAQLASVLSFDIGGRFGRDAKDQLAMYGRLPNVMTAAELAAHLEQRLRHAPLHLAGGVERIETVAWCSGAAQSYIEMAASQGVDAFISGEVSESTTHFCREAGIHYFAAGHHATERYGVQALGQHLAEQFSIEHVFVDIANPV